MDRQLSIKGSFHSSQPLFLSKDLENKFLENLNEGRSSNDGNFYHSMEDFWAKVVKKFTALGYSFQEAMQLGKAILFSFILKVNTFTEQVKENYQEGISKLKAFYKKHKMQIQELLSGALVIVILGTMTVIAAKNDSIESLQPPTEIVQVFKKMDTATLRQIRNDNLLQRIELLAEQRSVIVEQIRQQEATATFWQGLREKVSEITIVPKNIVANITNSSVNFVTHGKYSKVINLKTPLPKLPKIQANLTELSKNIYETLEDLIQSEDNVLKQGALLPAAIFHQLLPPLPDISLVENRYYRSVERARQKIEILKKIHTTKSFNTLGNAEKTVLDALLLKNVFCLKDQRLYYHDDMVQKFSQFFESCDNMEPKIINSKGMSKKEKVLSLRLRTKKDLIQAPLKILPKIPFSRF